MSKPKNIFLIEDDEYDQHFFEMILKSIPGTVLCGMASDGQEALHMLEGAAEVPDIIFTDLHMPRMDGLICISELQRRPQLRRIPVIVLSSDESKADVARRIGARGFVKKSADINTLKDKIAMLLHLDYRSDTPAADQTFEMRYRK